MNIEPFLIASTVRVIVGQRLVRKLCPDCRIAIKPDQATLADLSKAFNLDKPGAMAHLHELEKQAISEQLGGDTTEPGTTGKTIASLWQAHDEGCDTCNHTGYKGRMGIYEVLENNEAIQKLIVSGATSDTIEQTAIEHGMVTMQVDGVIKALRGMTTIEEILRVTATGEA